MKTKVWIFFIIMLLALFYAVLARNLLGNNENIAFSPANIEESSIGQGPNMGFNASISRYTIGPGFLKVYFNFKDYSGTDRFISINYVLKDADENEISSGKRSVFLSSNVLYIFELKPPNAEFYDLEFFITDGSSSKLIVMKNVGLLNSVVTGYASYPLVFRTGSKTALIIALFIVALYLAARFYTRRNSAQKLSSGIMERYIRLKPGN